MAGGHRNPSPAPPRPARPYGRIAVLLEPGRLGAIALDRAAALACEYEANLTVVAFAPQARPPRCGGEVPPDDYNDIVCATVLDSLAQAARRIGCTEPPARFELLVGDRDLPLSAWVAREAFDLVLLPSRRPVLGHPRHPQARRLRHTTGAEVRIVS